MEPIITMNNGGKTRSQNVKCEELWAKSFKRFSFFAAIRWNYVRRGAKLAQSWLESMSCARQEEERKRREVEKQDGRRSHSFTHVHSHFSHFSHFSHSLASLLGEVALGAGWLDFMSSLAGATQEGSRAAEEYGNVNLASLHFFGGFCVPHVMERHALQFVEFVP